jgi:hypothetical protein
MVEIEIGGKTRTLRYTLNSLKEAQQELGFRGFGDIEQVLLSFNGILTFLYAGLKTSDPKITKKEIGDWDMIMIDVAKVIGKELTSFIGVPSEQSDGSPTNEGN